MTQQRAQPTTVPLAELQRFEPVLKEALHLFRSRATTLRDRHFEPAGAELVTEAADDLADLLAIIRPSPGGTNP